MNVGIFLKSREQEEGGGYTITYDILETLLNNPKLIKHKLFFVIVNQISKKTKYLLKKNNINYINIKEHIYFFKLKNLIFSLFNFSLKIFNFLNLNKVDNYFKKNNVKIIWPISSEYRYPFSIPYFFTVWDIQYKSISQYKEVGSFLTKFYRDQLVKTNIKYSKFIIVGNQTGRKELLKYYKMNKKKIILNSHPTPTWATKKNINFSNILKKKKIKNYFFYPANFWSHKNHLNLIKGFYIFNKNNNNSFQLVLVGSNVDKENFSKIKEFIVSRKIQNHVRILGYVDRRDLLTLYDNCLALTYLSVSGPENLPPLEAFARGKPVLYSNFIGAKEQLKNYPLYVNYNDPKKISKSLEKIIKKKYIKKKYKDFSKSKSTTIYISKINKTISRLDYL